MVVGTTLEHVDLVSEEWWETEEGLQVLTEVHIEVTRLTTDEPDRYASAADHLRRSLADWAEHHWGPQYKGASLKRLKAHANKVAASLATCSDGACSLAGMASGLFAMEEHGIRALVQRYHYDDQRARDVYAWIMEDPP